MTELDQILDIILSDATEEQSNRIKKYFEMQSEVTDETR